MYHLDYETFSPVDLKSCGPSVYSEHPQAEILCLAIARGDEGPYLWVNPEHGTPDPRAVELLRRLCNDSIESPVWAHNAGFEWAVTRNLWHRTPGLRQLPPPTLDRWKDTAVLARQAGLPGKLNRVTKALGIAEKSPDGPALIRRFCIPQKDGSRIRPKDDPEGFARLGAYCVQDVVAERELHRKLEAFESATTPALAAAWQFDKVLNDRGIPVNLKALRHAQKIIDTVMAVVGTRFRKTTGLNPTQNAKCKAWFHAKGLKLPNLQADTIEAWLPKAKPDVRQALQDYATLQFAAVKKVAAMLQNVSGDGYLRGLFMFYGAGTGRWSGQRVQPHNFKRPTVKDTDLAYRMICNGCSAEDLDLLWGNALDVLSSCIRNFMQPHQGDLIDADYAAIEARIVCWLADQEDTLREFRLGIDPYKSMAAYIYGCSRDDIGNPSHEREVGKRAVLGCGFNMGAPKFREQCEVQYGLIISEELAQRAVEGYRRKNYRVAQLWELTDNAARAAIDMPGRRCYAGRHISFIVETRGGIPYLLMRLPSGRELAYPWPKLEVVESRFGRARKQVTFFGQLPNSALWGRVSTYGGKLVENATQATAFDIMANGAVNAEAEKFRIFALIHDQALAFRGPGQTAEQFVNLLTSLPAWAKGLPIKAEGKIAPYYKKG